MDQAEGTRKQDQPENLAVRCGGHGADDGGDDPQQRIALVGGAGELVSRDRDDRQHGRSDAEENLMNDGQALVFGVEHGDRCDEQARGQHERDCDGRRPEDTGLQKAEPHRQLSRKRTGHRLREGQTLPVLVPAEPTPPLDQAALHVADQRNRPTKPDEPSLRK
jgi:hypothetical protein